MIGIAIKGCLPPAMNEKILRPTLELGENLLPRCHRVASLLKRWLLGTHQGAVRPKQLDYYLDEFTFRFNRRNSQSRGKLFKSGQVPTPTSSNRKLLGLVE